MEVTVQMIKSVVESKKMSLRKFSLETGISTSQLSFLFRGERKIGFLTEHRFLEYIKKSEKAWLIANMTPSTKLDLSEEEVELLKLLRAFPDVKEKVLSSLRYKSRLKLKDKQLF